MVKLTNRLRWCFDFQIHFHTSQYVSIDTKIPTKLPTLKEKKSLSFLTASITVKIKMIITLLTITNVFILISHFFNSSILVLHIPFEQS